MSHTHSYFGYGLQISSEVPLTELPAGRGAPDVAVRLGDLREFAVDRERTHTFAASARELGRHWQNVGAFLARDGREVVVAPAARVQTRSLSPFITGPMMACLLHQRGALVLHSSALQLDGGRGIAFLAESGEGKSTLAAYLAQHGARLVADDVVPVYFDEKGARTVPGYPQIRLWKDSLATIGADHERLPRVNEFIDKRFFPVSRAASAPAVALDALYILEEAPFVRIERLPPAEAFFELTRHSYLKRYLEATDSTAGHFEQCAELTRRLPVYKLKRPRDFAHLPAVAEALES